MTPLAAVPISNRQLVHGSFANTSPDRRVTVNFGFLPRASVLNVMATQLDGRVEPTPPPGPISARG